MMRIRALLPALALLTACGDTGTEASADEPLVAAPTLSASILGSGDNIVDHANALLAASGSEYRVAYAEYITSEAQPASDNIIFARDVGNKRLSLDFVPNDPRRGGIDGNPNTIDVLIDRTQGVTGNGLSEAATTASIGRAMASWDAQRCSALGMNIVPVEVDLGLVQAILGFGGGAAVPDIMHAGWLPADFFDLLAPQGSSFILGVTFTLTFLEGDLDGDGAPDLAAREIYYNDAFPWSTTGVGGADVESIALHEAGHALSQAHFGKVFVNQRSGKLLFSPRAVMNAVYVGPNRSLTATDNAGHCGLWGNWPQR
jgi:hypothetical protein